MRLLIAGATGAIGRGLTQAAVASGHEVVAMVRSSAGSDLARSIGARVVTADALDRNAVVEAVRSARPDVVVNELTAIPRKVNIAKIDRDFAATNRLRTIGTDNLIAGAQAAGVGRIVAQSFAGWPYARHGGPIKSEADPLDPQLPAALRQTLGAIKHLEAAVTGTPGIEGIALRYGFLYGPTDAVGGVGAVVPDVKRRRLPIVGSGAGVWTFVHVDDVVSATLAAIAGHGSGIYNIVDDEPAPVSVWLPELARIVGASPPLHVPAWVGRVVIGEVGVVWMTDIRGASNIKAKSELQWTPRWTSWRDGFRHEFGSTPPAARMTARD